MRRIRNLFRFARLVLTPSGRKGLQLLPSVEDVRRRAERRLPRMIFDFIDGGGGHEHTLRANEDELAKVTLRPRVLVDVSAQDITARIAGLPRRLPLVLGPAGLMRTAGNGGELAAVRAAGSWGVPYTISTSSAVGIEEIAAAATGPLWFQLYLWRSRELVRELVQRADAAGCEALVLTVDVPLNANRLRDLRNGMSIPPRLSAGNALQGMLHPRWLLQTAFGDPIGFKNFEGTVTGNASLSHSEFINQELSNLAASWEDARWLRSIWGRRIYVKGIMTAADAQRALDAGADGIIVSNHGGRQLDGQPSTISALPSIAAALQGRAEVLIDGGFRTGGDVIRAIALGASGVLVARPWAYGVAAGGQKGVERVLEIFEQELKQGLALMGAGSLAEIDRSFVRYPGEWDEGR